MLPGLYEFRWDAPHVLFLGAFFFVLGCITTVLVMVVRQSRRSLAQHRLEAIRWHGEFHDLPEAARRCRHELAGQVGRRTCDHAFECGTCETHPKLAALPVGATPEATTDHAAAPPAGDAQPPSRSNDLFGFDMPLDRLYHRGHTWVQPQPDGTVLVGLDDFAKRLLGEPDDVVLPAPGTHLRTHATGWLVVKAGNDRRILSPIDGTVREARGCESGWTLRLEPEDTTLAFVHLLRGDEIRPWLGSELQRLQKLLAPEVVGQSLADGGALAPDFASRNPSLNWSPIWDEFLLQV
jgi:hypothetical protein